MALFSPTSRRAQLTTRTLTGLAVVAATLTPAHATTEPAAAPTPQAAVSATSTEPATAPTAAMAFGATTATTEIAAAPSASLQTSGRTYRAPLRTAIKSLRVAKENNAGYSRDRQFGHWTDTNRDCQNTRAEVLIAESKRAVTYTSKRRCKVLRGRWVTTLDNRTQTNALQLEVDHLVPVAEAWGSGARHWSKAKRVRFYNDLGDPRSLNAQSRAVNQAKRAYGPEAWMPKVNRCKYINDWVAVKIRWNLSVDAREQAALTRYGKQCANVTLRVTKA
ncbi:HNH endonuclease family protein [Kytococcus sedentarius]|uniref:HNH endonuclease family protein n=1 Tax=Kytococcus sedentarius TaxID=1276 RepID=UPI0035BBCF9F